MESFFGRLVRDLKHKQERGDVAEQVPPEVVEDYVAFFSRTKSYFEQLLNTHQPVMVMGFHQESAADYLLRLERTIPRMEKLAKQKNTRIEWMP